MNNHVACLQTSPWEDIVSCFPTNWQEKALAHEVMKGARQDKDIENTIHVLLIYLVCGLSLKETVTRSRLAGLYFSSHVALRERLIKFGPFFEDMGKQLFCAQNSVSPIPGIKLRLIDATDIKEPGPTGSTWRFHYSFTLPDMACDYTKLTEARGVGVGESFMHFPISPGDLLIADRGYCRANGISYVRDQGGYVCVRLHHASLPLYTPDGHAFRLVSKLKTITCSGQVMEWDCAIRAPDSLELIPGRICAIRKSKEQIKIAHKKCDRSATKNQNKHHPDTYFVNEFVIVFTTFDRERFPLPVILAIYRWRWQVELAFKRFKSLLQLGHLPTKADESSKAWLHGKLFAALLIEHISRSLNGNFSPWRCFAEEDTRGESVDNVRVFDALSETVAVATLDHEGDTGKLESN